MTPSTDAIDWCASDCRWAAWPKSTRIDSSAEATVGGAATGDFVSSASRPASRNASRMDSKFGVPSDDAVVFLVELLGTLKSFQNCGVSGHLRRAMRAFAPPGHTGPHRVLTCANNFLWWRLAGMSQRDDIREPQPDACKLFMNVSLLDPLFAIDDPALLFKAKERALVDAGGTATKDDARAPWP